MFTGSWGGGQCVDLDGSELLVVLSCVPTCNGLANADGGNSESCSEEESSECSVVRHEVECELGQRD